jgi:hypothetical protein
MKVLGILCNCKFCSPTVKQAVWYPCGCVIGQEVPEHYKHKVDGILVDGQIYPLERIVQTGGRNAVWIYLDEDEEAIWLSAGKRGTKFENEIARFDASVHGCWKVKLHQELVIVKKIK